MATLIAGHEIVYSVVEAKAGHPLNRENPEDHFQAELSRNKIRSVRNWTERVPSQVHDGCMGYEKAERIRPDATSTSVKREMAKPRMAGSARTAERN
jgi:hypothetical protein